MKKIFIATCLLLFAWCVKAQLPEDFAAFRDKFIEDYKALNIPETELSYAANLQHIQSLYNIQKQQDFFTEANKKLTRFESLWITDEERFDLDLMKFETKLNLQRLALEKRWIEEKPTIIPENNLYSIPHSHEWYAYFVNRWLGAFVNVDELYFNGTEEIEKVKAQINDICIKKGLSEAQLYIHLNDSIFYTTKETQLQQAFAHVQQTVQRNLSNIFHVKQVDNVNIQTGRNEALAQTPGYYSNNIFYYNFSGKPYCIRQIAWLYLHEAVPGHHYQSCISIQTPQSKVQQLFHYSGFAEGWAAYTETLGKELGAYETAYDEIGHLEWDLVRSVRVILDIGLNYYGWTDEKALAKWKEYIPNQDDIAMREINRMKRWPAQVITYKYGSTLFLQWKKELQKQQGTSFDLRDFHDRILGHGSLPFFMVRKNVFKKDENTASK